jgi:hypothetical protein
MPGGPRKVPVRFAGSARFSSSHDRFQEERRYFGAF